MRPEAKGTGDEGAWPTAESREENRSRYQFFSVWFRISFKCLTVILSCSRFMASLARINGSMSRMWHIPEGISILIAWPEDFIKITKAQNFAQTIHITEIRS